MIISCYYQRTSLVPYNRYLGRNLVRAGRDTVDFNRSRCNSETHFNGLDGERTITIFCAFRSKTMPTRQPVALKNEKRDLFPNRF